MCKVFEDVGTPCACVAQDPNVVTFSTYSLRCMAADSSRQHSRPRGASLGNSSLPRSRVRPLANGTRTTPVCLPSATRRDEPRGGRRADRQASTRRIVALNEGDNSPKVDLRIQGLPHSTAEQADNSRRTTVKELIHQIENHPLQRCTEGRFDAKSNAQRIQ